MKRQPRYLQTRELPEKDTTALKNLLTASKTQECKKATNENLKSCLNFKMASYVFLVAVIGIIFYAQDIAFANTYVAKLKNVINLNKKTENLENIQLKIASLSRVINSIALQNSFQRESITTKKVIAAALDVHDPHILHAIERADVQNATSTIKTLDLLANQSMDTITKITIASNKLALRHDTTSFDAPNSPVLFNVSNFSFKEEVLEIIYTLNKNIRSLIDELKSPSPQKEKIEELYLSIKGDTNLYSFHIKLSFPQLQPLFDSLENSRSFIVDIEQYQLLTNNTYSTHLIKSLDNLQPYTTTIETLSNCERIQHITEQFDDLNKLINKRVNIFDKYTLLGLPQGSENLEIYLEDFDDKWLEKMLNNGHSLIYLKNLLMPITNWKTDLTAMKNAWTKFDTNSHSNLVRLNSKPFKSIFKTKSVFNSTFLANVKTALQNLKPISNLNNSVLNEFKRFLDSWATIVQNFSTEVNISMQTGDFLFRTMVNINCKTYSDDYNFESCLERMRKVFFSGIIEQNAQLLTAKFRFIENQKTKINNLLFETTAFKNTLTDAVFSKIRQILPHHVKQDLKTIMHNVQLIRSLMLHAKTERAKINQLIGFLWKSKNRITKLRELENKLKAEISRTNELHRLSNSPFAHETAFQLDCTHRTLMFFQRSDLRHIAQSFVVSGIALSEKIQSLPFGEKQFIAQTGKEFKSMNQSITNFLTKIEALNSKFFNEGQSLKSLGKLSSVLDQINVSAFHLPLMISALNKLKATSIGQSKEVADFEKSLEQLESLQFAIMRKKGILPLLLGETETFLKLFFAKQIKSETDSERQPFLLILITFAVALVCALVVFYLWIRTSKDVQKVNQCKEETVELGKKQKANSC